MNRLFEIGFERIGTCALDGERFQIAYLGEPPQRRNAIYAFVCGEKVLYVGKTARTLHSRLYGYIRPGPTQGTNIAVSAKIISNLESGQKIEVLAYFDDGAASIGAFHLNTADGLESDIIKTYSPPWNVAGIMRSSTAANATPPISSISASARAANPDAAAKLSIRKFEIRLGSAYWNQGFLNVPVKYGHLFAGDGAHLDIFLGDTCRSIAAHINRTANPSGMPRLMGGAALKEWLHRHCKFKGLVKVESIDPRTIRVHGSKF